MKETLDFSRVSREAIDGARTRGQNVKTLENKGFVIFYVSFV